MTIKVIKRNLEVVPFDASKIRKWIKWAINGNDPDKENFILSETLRRLPEIFTTEKVHETIIQICLNQEDIEYSKIAAMLERASIHKAQTHAGILNPLTADFMDFLEFFEYKKKWGGDWMDEIDSPEKIRKVNHWYIELEQEPLDYWTVKQWTDKYSVKLNNEAVETPALGILAIAIGLHGVTQLAFDVAKDIIQGRLNLPTPVLNGIRNGSYDSISCCVIEGGDTVASIDVADYVASSMTAKKAGIGITLDTRSKGDRVKNGSVSHLGKAPLYKAIQAGVKKYTQETRGGSATVTYKCIDPDIMEMLLWKTQKVDLEQRIDKVDYSFAYNDDFILALLRKENWYLFSKVDAPEVHDNLHAPNYMEYVEAALRRGAKHKVVKAIELLMTFLISRSETGRIYAINLTRMNEHTPFVDRISQSNLCLEIALPTKPWDDMADLFRQDVENAAGEIAFCSIAALNAAKIPFDKYFEVAERALRTVDEMINRAPMLSMAMRYHLTKRRSVGIGITGLASWLYQQGMDYDGSKSSIRATEQLAELHYYSLLKASQKMSAESGIKVKGIKPDWLPVDTKKKGFAPLLDWEALRGKPRKHSVLVAHMPTESSAVFSGATNGLYPSRSRVIYKKARKGVVQFISEFFVGKTPAWDVDMIPYYAAVQNWSDQAISADYFTDFTKLENSKVKDYELVKWFILQAIAGIKTIYYQNFKDTEGDSLQDIMQKEEDCAGCKL